MSIERVEIGRRWIKSEDSPLPKRDGSIPLMLPPPVSPHVAWYKECSSMLVSYEEIDFGNAVEGIDKRDRWPFTQKDDIELAVGVRMTKWEVLRIFRAKSVFRSPMTEWTRLETRGIYPQHWIRRDMCLECERYLDERSHRREDRLIAEKARIGSSISERMERILAERAKIYHYAYTPDDLEDKFLGRGPIFIGIELELETGYPQDCSRLFTRDGRWYAKHDGSIAGVEAVSYPASWLWWVSYKWKWLEGVREYAKSYDANPRMSCGMHVHISKRAFEDIHIERMLEFAAQNRGRMLQISKRPPRNLNRWAAIEPRKRAKKIVEAMYDGGELPPRYRSINICPRDTIEFRLFRGTLKRASIEDNLSFAIALSTFVQNPMAKKSLGWKNFMNFLRTPLASLILDRPHKHFLESMEVITRTPENNNACCLAGDNE